ncbi:hypothetical protein GCM10010238_40140 [Streptomyces griseoviridis]|uniref:Uncharacterized protein n=1 Tax=Streptomyces griseoviridis TaxID=45398 RepID=A0A918LH20_STRGD|nr:hypothetical protein GCM10010238_40140 [Streptomyces niveoruber]
MKGTSARSSRAANAPPAATTITGGYQVPGCGFIRRSGSATSAAAKSAVPGRSSSRVTRPLLARWSAPPCRGSRTAERDRGRRERDGDGEGGPPAAP